MPDIADPREKSERMLMRPSISTSFPAAMAVILAGNFYTDV